MIHGSSLDTALEVSSILLTLLEADDADDCIAVDLDGTLAKYTGWKGATKIGEPIPAMVNRVRRWVGHGKKVKIFTARADDERSVNAIKKWLKANELPDLEITNLKDQHMTCFYDDRAVSVEKNTGRIKEAADQPWGPDWRPQPAQVAWFAELIRVTKDGAEWGAPGTQQVYKIDHRAKTFTLIIGNPNDPDHWYDKIQSTLAELGWTVLDGRPSPPDVQVFAEAIVEELLLESPTIATLEKHRIGLEPGERQQIMRAKAVWHHGKNGAESPAIHKAIVGGKTWWWSNTHRCGQVRPTLKGAIRSFYDIVKPSA
jgi:hypothetical protein